MNRIWRISFILISVFLLVSCSESKDPDIELGEVKEIEEVNLQSENIEESLYESHSAKDGYKTLHNYFSGMSIDYPEELNPNIESSNIIKFYDPDSYTTIYIESSLRANNFDLNEQESVPLFLSSFDAKLDAQTFTTPTNAHAYRYVDEHITKPQNGTEKNEDEKIVICNDYNPLYTADRNKARTNTKMAERRYYIKFNNVNTVISLITTPENFENKTPIIDYMVNSITATDETYNEVNKYPFFTESDLSISLPKLFGRRDIKNKVYGDGVIYQVPMDSLSSMSGMYLQVYKLNTIESSTRDFDSWNLFSDAFPSEIKHLSNMGSTYEIDVDNFDSVVGGLSKFSEVKNGYFTNQTIYRTSLGGSRLIEFGDTWCVESYIVSKNSSDYLISVGYLLPKADVARKIFSQVFSE